MNNGFNYENWEKRQRQIEEVHSVLQTRDFEKAAALAPDGYKLCGYQEFSEPFEYEQYGYGWAGQFEHTAVQPGLYPVFCCEYAYNEREHSFTNKIKDYPGLCFWYKGIVVASNIGENISKPNTVFAHPYAHSVAKDIIEDNSNARLLAPFEARTIHFESLYDGEMHKTYHIVDTSIPSLVKSNPMLLNRPSTNLPLEKQILKSKSNTTLCPSPKQETKPFSTKDHQEER